MFVCVWLSAILVVLLSEIVESIYLKIKVSKLFFLFGFLFNNVFELGSIKFKINTLRTYLEDDFN